MKLPCFLQILTLLFSVHYSAQNRPGQWKYLGPNGTTEQVKGLFKAVWVDENNMNFILAGSSSGGLFKSENAMSERPFWINLTDSYEGMNYGVSDIVVKPNSENKIIYIASGHKSGLALGYGNGILKSIDGGKSWFETGPKAKVKNLFCLEGLVANKENPEEMMAYSSNELFITKDDWKTFEIIDLPIKKDNNDISLCDADFAPHEKGKFYVCTRTNNHYDSKLFVCEEYGKKVTDITPKDVKSERVEVTTLENEKHKGKFYAALGTHDAFVKYYDGKNFHALNINPINHTFSGTYWNLELDVNQMDTNIIYVSMTETSRSTDGGKTFTKIGTYNGKNTHADVRAMKLLKSTAEGKNDALFLANDGGISFTEKYDPLDWKNLNGETLNGTQFWGIDIAQSDSLMLSGGAQDNGGFLISKQECLNTISNCGDGYLSAAVDENSAIVECNPPSLFYHNIKTKEVMYLQVADAYADPRRPFISKDSFIYIGYHDIWRINKKDPSRGKNQFLKFSNIPFDKTEDGGIRNQVIKSMHIGENSAVVSYANPLWSDKQISGKFYFCANINEKDLVWTDLSAKIVLGNLEICRWTEIIASEIDIKNPNKFYLISRDQFNQTNSLLLQVEYFPDSAKCVVEKINFNLPKLGINTVKTDKFSNVIYVGCDDGVYYCFPGTDSLEWNKLNFTTDKMPNVMVTSMAFNYYNNTLVAGTYGRGAWQTQLVNSGYQFRTISTNKTENEAVKVDGTLIVNKKKIYTINSKLILTKGSRIQLKKGSTLVIKDKKLIRDENNNQLDLLPFLNKGSGAKVIYKN